MLRLKNFFLHKIILVPLLIFLYVPAICQETIQRLFYFEKSQSENIICYDVHITRDGRFSSKQAVEGYWYNTIEKKRHELNWIEQMLAYGFDYNLDKKTNTISLKMRALKKRPMTVFIKDGKAVAQLTVSGKMCYMEKVYIKVAKHLYPPLEYIEIFGTEILTGKQIVERIYPKSVL